MFSATRTKVLLAGGSAAALTILAASHAGGLLHANEPVDQVVTGTVAPVIADVVKPMPAPLAVKLPVAAEVVPAVPASLQVAAVRPGWIEIPAPPTKVPDPELKSVLDMAAEGDGAGAYQLAGRFDDEARRHAAQWAAITYGNGAVPFAAVLAFAKDAPAFTTDGTYRTRLEQAVTRERPGSAKVIELLGGSMPSTLYAQIALAQAYVAEGQKQRAARIARTIWTENFLDQSTEKLVLDRLGDLLDRDAHWARAQYLMMNDRASGAERLAKYLTPAQKSLLTARNATSRNAKNAKKLLDAVDPSMRADPVYLFSRAQRARQFELWDDALDYLDKIKGNPIGADQIWYERRTLTRQLLALGEVKRAYRAADGYRDGPEGRLVDAHFHAGWIALSFLKDPKAAAAHFEAMAQHTTLPDTITQANYWLGRARQTLGDPEGASAAYEAATRFGTVYYGQLAREALGQPSTEIREMPEWQSAEPAFEGDQRVKAVRMLAANGHKDMAVRLLRSFATELQTGPELLLAARLAQSLDEHHLTIMIADAAEKRGVPLDLLNFPKDGLPHTRIASIDVAAVYAIARQESRFQIDAVSSAGARGLMQLMPATAKETAGKIGIDYSKSRLTSDPEYNTLLGSTYLKAQLERFDGSLVLAAAAYNAGGGNANKWIRLFGDPRSEQIDPVVWVELIPVLETRNYVKRVVGNYLVYRARLGRDDMSISEVLRQIPG
ncbi:MAG: lytic transglycosylase domain-containing protein [Devosia sp.]